MKRLVNWLWWLGLSSPCAPLSYVAYEELLEPAIHGHQMDLCRCVCFWKFQDFRYFFPVYSLFEPNFTLTVLWDTPPHQHHWEQPVNEVTPSPGWNRQSCTIKESQLYNQPSGEGGMGQDAHTVKIQCTYTALKKDPPRISTITVSSRFMIF